MMMRIPLIIGLSFLFFPMYGFPVGERTVAGSRSAGMGGCGVSLPELWSVRNNPACVAWVDRISAGFFCENRFLLKSMFYEQFGLVLPTRAGNFGLFADHSGSGQAHVLRAGLIYSRKFGNHFSAGVAADYLGLMFPGEYGNKNMINCEFGLFYQPRKYIAAGVHVVNPVPVKITTHPDETLPTTFCLGLTWFISGSFLVSLEAEKDLVNDPIFRLGGEYRVVKSFIVRLGASSAPFQFDLGMGILWGPVMIDVATGYHQVLGFTPSCSIIYCFPKGGRKP